VSFSNDPKAVIPWVVRAIHNMLEAAAKTASIKRVVLVSSSSTTDNLYPDPRGREIHQGKLQSLQEPSKTDGLWRKTTTTKGP